MIEHPPGRDDPSTHRVGELLAIEQQVRGDAVVLQVGGEVDLSTAEEFRGAMLNAITLGNAPHRVVVDLTGVGFFGSAGLAALLTAREQARHHDVPLRIVAAGSAVRRPIEVTGLAQELDLYPTVASAIDPVSPRDEQPSIGAPGESRAL